MVSLTVEHGCTDGLAISLMRCEPVGFWNLEAEWGWGLEKDPLKWEFVWAWGPEILGVGASTEENEDSVEVWVERPVQFCGPLGPKVTLVLS